MGDQSVERFVSRMPCFLTKLYLVVLSPSCVPLKSQVKIAQAQRSYCHCLYQHKSCQSHKLRLILVPHFRHFSVELVIFVRVFGDVRQLNNVVLTSLFLALGLHVSSGGFEQGIIFDHGCARLWPVQSTFRLELRFRSIATVEKLLLQTFLSSDLSLPNCLVCGCNFGRCHKEKRFLGSSFPRTFPKAISRDSFLLYL